MSVPCVDLSFPPSPNCIFLEGVFCICLDEVYVHWNESPFRVVKGTLFESIKMEGYTISYSEECIR